MFQRIPTSYDVRQAFTDRIVTDSARTRTYDNVQQRITTYYDVLHRIVTESVHITTYYNKLQRATMFYNAPLCITTHYKGHRPQRLQTSVLMISAAVGGRVCFESKQAGHRHIYIYIYIYIYISDASAWTPNSAFTYPHCFAEQSARRTEYIRARKKAIWGPNLGHFCWPPWQTLS